MKNRKQKSETEDVKIYPDVLPDRLYGAFSMYTASDPAGHFEAADPSEPSDGNAHKNSPIYPN